MGGGTRGTRSELAGPGLADTQFTNNPIFSTIRMILSKGTTIQLSQRQKSNSFSIRGVAYITRHSLVKSIGEDRKKRQMGA